MTAPLRVGLIGTGQWGARHAATMAELPAIVRLERAASRASPPPPWLSCRHSHRWRDVAEAADVDAVVIATPRELHAAMALAAMAAGKAVLVEKPVATSAGGARVLAGAAKRHDVVAWAGHVDLFHPAYLRLKTAARDEGVSSLEAEFGGPEAISGDWGVLWEHGPHPIGLCLDLAGADPASLAARRIPRTGGDLSLELTFGSGLSARIALSDRLPVKTRRLRLTTHRGSVWEYDDRTSNQLTVGPRGGERTAVACAGDKPLTALLRGFAEAVRSRSDDRACFDLAVRAVSILDQAAAQLSRQRQSH